MMPLGEEKELKVGWEKTTLQEVTILRNEKVEPATIGSVPYISLEHIESETNKILDRGDSKDVKSLKSVFCSGDVLYGKLRPYLNKVCQPEFDGVCSTDILVFKPSPSIDSRFLLKLLSSRKTVEFANSNSKGINLPRISPQRLGDLPIDLPPLEEQKRIVAKIEELQSHSRRAKEALKTIPDLLEQLRQSILGAAFRGDLTKSWREKEPVFTKMSELLKNKIALPPGYIRRKKISKRTAINLDPSIFCQIPKTWQYCSIQELYDAGFIIDFEDGNHGSLYPRKTDFEEEGVLFVTAQLIQNGQINFCETPHLNRKKADELKKGWSQGGDVLLTHNATVGRVARVPHAQREFLLGTSATFYRPHPDVIDQDYLYYAMESYIWQEQLRRIMEQTTRNQVSIQKQAFLKIPIAPLPEQKMIAQVLNNFFERFDSVKNYQIEALRINEELDQSILTKSFCGELVPQDPDDEPASILLQRIREEAAQRAPMKKSRPRKTRKRSPMKKMDKANVLKIIESMPQVPFGFDELRAKLPGDYDTLKGILFALLDDPQSGIIQVFDEQAKAMRFSQRAKR